MTRVKQLYTFQTPDGTRLPATGEFSWKPTAPRIIPGDPDEIVVPKAFTSKLVDGLLSVEVVKTDPSWVWHVVIKIDGLQQRAIYVSVPDTTEVDFSDLPIIDLSTLTPVSTPEPAWWAMANSTVNTGSIVGNDLVLTRTDGTQVVAGNVRGPAGTDGVNGTNGIDGVDGSNGTDGLDYTGPTITVSATEPISPVEGDLWFDIS